MRSAPSRRCRSTLPIANSGLCFRNAARSIPSSPRRGATRALVRAFVGEARFDAALSEPRLAEKAAEKHRFRCPACNSRGFLSIQFGLMQLLFGPSIAQVREV